MTVATIVAVGCGDDGGGGGNADGENITVLFARQVPDADYAPLWAASSLGYFADEGLDVSVQTTGGSPDAVQLLNAGQGDIAIPGAEATIQGRSQGMDLRDYYTWQQSLIFSVAGLEGVESAADLDGARIGVLGLSSSTVNMVRVLASDAGVDPDSLDFVPLGVGGPAVAAVAGGEVDAVAYHDTQMYQFEEDGVDLNYLDDQQFASYFTAGLAVRAGDLESRRDELVGFARALSKATVYCEANPRACVEAMGDEVPEVLDDMDTSIALLELRLDVHHLPSEAEGLWGWNNAERYNEFADFLVEAGFVEDDGEIEEIWAGDDLLREINDFDSDVVIADAESESEGA